MANERLLSMESDLREVMALSDVLHALGTSEREIDQGTVYVLADLLEATALRLRDRWQELVEREREAAA